jgi:Ca2+-binding EF-hand superfamily protein
MQGSAPPRSPGRRRWRPREWKRLLCNSYVEERRAFCVRLDREHGLGAPARRLDLSAWREAQLECEGTEREGLLRCGAAQWLELRWRNATLSDAFLRRVLLGPQLQVLDLAGCCLLGDGAAAAIGATCGALRRVDLSGCTLLTDRGVAALACGAAGVALEWLALDRCVNVTDEAVAVCLDRCAALESASFRFNPNVRGDGFLSLPDAQSQVLLVVHRRLAALRLGGCSALSDESVRWAAESLLCLERLDLSGCGAVTDRAVAHLERAHGGRLRELNLAGCAQLSEAAILSLSRLHHLQDLDVSGIPGVTSRALAEILGRCSFLGRLVASGCERLHRLPFNIVSGLHTLQLAGCAALGDAALSSLAGLGCAAALCELDLAGCAQVTAAGLIALAARHRGSLTSLDVSCCAALQDLDWALLPLAARAGTKPDLVVIGDDEAETKAEHGVSSSSSAAIPSAPASIVGASGGGGGGGDGSRGGACRQLAFRLHAVGLSGLAWLRDEQLWSVVDPELTERLGVCECPHVRRLAPCCASLQHVDASGTPLDWSMAVAHAPMLRFQLGDPGLSLPALLRARFALEDASASAIQRHYRAFAADVSTSLAYLLFKNKRLTHGAASKVQACWRRFRIPRMYVLVRRLTTLQRRVKAWRWAAHADEHLREFRRKWAAATTMEALARGGLYRRGHSDVMIFLANKSFRRLFKSIAVASAVQSSLGAAFHHALLGQAAVPADLRRKDPLYEMGLVLREGREAVELKKRMLAELTGALYVRSRAKEAKLLEAYLARKSLFAGASRTLQRWARRRVLPRLRGVVHSREALARSLEAGANDALWFGRELPQGGPPVEDWVLAGLACLQAHSRGWMERERPLVAIEADKSVLGRYLEELRDLFARQQLELDSTRLLRGEAARLKGLRSHYESSPHPCDVARFEYYTAAEGAMSLRAIVSERFHTNYVRRALYLDQAEAAITAHLAQLARLVADSRALLERLKARARALDAGEHGYADLDDVMFRALRQGERESWELEVLQIEARWVEDMLKLLEPVHRRALFLCRRVARLEAKRITAEFQVQGTAMRLFRRQALFTEQEGALQKELLSTMVDRANLKRGDARSAEAEGTPEQLGGLTTRGAVSHDLRLLRQEQRLTRRLALTTGEAEAASQQLIDICTHRREPFWEPDRGDVEDMERKLKRVRREFRHLAWTALVPVELHKPESIAALHFQLQASRNLIGNADALVEAREELAQVAEEAQQKDVEELQVLVKKGQQGETEDVLTELVMDAAAVTASAGSKARAEIENVRRKNKRRGGLGAALADLLLNTAARRERRMLAQAIVSRQRGQVGFTEAICDVIITVGEQEHDEVEKESKRDRLAGISPFKKVPANLARAFEIADPVFFWFKASVDPMEQVHWLKVRTDAPGPGELDEHVPEAGGSASASAGTGAAAAPALDGPGLNKTQRQQLKQKQKEARLDKERRPAEKRRAELQRARAGPPRGRLLTGALKSMRNIPATRRPPRLGAGQQDDSEEGQTEQGEQEGEEGGEGDGAGEEDQVEEEQQGGEQARRPREDLNSTEKLRRVLESGLEVLAGQLEVVAATIDPLLDEGIERAQEQVSRASAKVRPVVGKVVSKVRQLAGVDPPPPGEAVVTHPRLPNLRLTLYRDGTPEQALVNLKVACTDDDEEVLKRMGYTRMGSELKCRHPQNKVRDVFLIWTLRQDQVGLARVLRPYDKLLELRAEFEQHLVADPMSGRLQRVLDEVNEDIREYLYLEAARREASAEGATALSSTVDALGLTKKEIARLARCFAAMDTEHSGEVTVEQLFYYIACPLNVVSRRLFAFLDNNKNERLDFGELLEALATFGLFSQKEVLQVCFNLVDPEGKGKVSLSQLSRFLAQEHDLDVNDHQDLSRAMRYTTETYENVLDFEQLREVVTRYPIMFKPVFDIQAAMQRSFLGTSWWEAKKRKYEAARAELRMANTKAAAKVRNMRVKRVKHLLGTGGATFDAVLHGSGRLLA